MESTLQKALEEKEKTEHLNSLAAITTPAKVLGVFGVLAAIALLIAELLRVAGFAWDPEKFLTNKLDAKTDGGRGAASPTFKGAAIASAVLTLVPVILLLAVALAIAAWAASRASSPPSLNEILPMVSRTTIYVPPSPSASAPVSSVVDPRKIDDNTALLNTQLALLTRATEQSAKEAQSTVAWVANVQSAASATQQTLTRAGTTAATTVAAAEKTQLAAQAVGNAASSIRLEAASAAQAWSSAAAKVDANTRETLRQIEAQDKNLKDTAKWLDNVKVNTGSR